MEIVQEKTLPLPMGFHNQKHYQSLVVKTFTWNEFHVDVACFLLQKWFFVVSFETDIFCVTQRHEFCNLVDFEFFAIFVARFLQKVDYFLCHQEKPNVNFFITYYIDTCPVCLEILHRVADHFGLSNQNKHWNPRQTLLDLHLMPKYILWNQGAPSRVWGSLISNKILFGPWHGCTESNAPV